jgi:hypothetical protein
MAAELEQRRGSGGVIARVVGGGIATLRERVTWRQLEVRWPRRGMKQSSRSLMSRSVVPMGGDVTVT